jgi:hypothetical protein
LERQISDARAGDSIEEIMARVGGRETDDDCAERQP